MTKSGLVSRNHEKFIAWNLRSLKSLISALPLVKSKKPMNHNWGNNSSDNVLYPTTQNTPLDQNFDARALLQFRHQNCIDCGQPRTSFAWCKPCQTKWYHDQFLHWTSENNELDVIIRDSQLNANMMGDFLEWIPYGQFEEVVFVAKGAFSTVYAAIWLEGPLWDWDEDIQVYERNGPIKVALKRLDNSQKLDPTFLDNLRRHRSCIQSSSLADTFGMTRDETGSYMFVMRYYDNGNLNNYLEKIHGDLSWRDKVDMLWGIAAGLDIIHKRGLYHGNIHGGNLLVEDEAVSTDAKIADLGISGPADKPANELCGVLPYVAPEVLRGEEYTMASDIYSFGMIMWVISTGLKPFSDRAHDGFLALELCNGLRPEISQDTPQCYVDLMKGCWNPDPGERPIASQLNDIFNRWVTEICDNPVANDIRDQFSLAEEQRWKIAQQSDRQITHTCHYQAVYTSRPLNFPQLQSHYGSKTLE